MHKTDRELNEIFPLEDFLPVAEIERIFQISRRTIRRWCNLGWLPPLRFGRRRYWKREEIEDAKILFYLSEPQS